MGKIFKYKHSPNWYYTSGDGKVRIRRSTGTANKKHAEMLQRKWDEELFLRKHGFSSKGITLEKLALKYLIIIESRKSKGWAKRIKASMNNFTSAHKGYNVKDFTPDVIDQYITLRLKNNTAPKTIKEDIAIVSNFFKYAIQQGNLLKNPCDDIILPKIVKVRPNKAMTKEEVRSVIKHTTNETDRLLLIILYYTGLRVGDAVTLDKSMIKNGCIERIQTKTGNKVIIPLHDDLKSLPIYKVTSYGAIARIRTRLKKVSMNNKAIVPWANLHSFRHTFATHLEENGASRYDVKTLLGHRTNEITSNYIHTSIDRLKTYINSLDLKLDGS